LRQQQDLSDQTFCKLQNSGPDCNDSAGIGAGPSGEDGFLAVQQKQLKRELKRQKGNLLVEGTQYDQEARRTLDEVGRAMEPATEDLEKGSVLGALDNQSKAIDALRKGMRHLG